MTDLRPHQVRLIEQLEQEIADRRHVVAQMATGGGKTIVAADIARRKLESSRRVLFIVPALELIDQTVLKFIAEGIPIGDIGVIQADHELTNWSRPVQIASVQTLIRRNLPFADLVIIDECHRVFEKNHRTPGRCMETHSSDRIVGNAMDSRSRQTFRKTDHRRNHAGIDRRRISLEVSSLRASVP
jgi:superfamily II DNA or RNA helicase